MVADGRVVVLRRVPAKKTARKASNWLSDSSISPHGKYEAKGQLAARAHDNYDNYKTFKCQKVRRPQEGNIKQKAASPCEI